MVAVVRGGDFAVAVAEETGHGLCGVEGEGFLEDVEGFRHGGVGFGVGVGVEGFLVVVLVVGGECEG